MPAPIPSLNHEKLHVYQASIEFIALAESTTEHLPKGNSPLIDQLRRAAMIEKTAPIRCHPLSAQFVGLTNASRNQSQTSTPRCPSQVRTMQVDDRCRKNHRKFNRHRVRDP